MKIQKFQANCKPISAIRTAVVIAGDLCVFFLFVVFGNTEHEITFWQTLLRTALPFGFVWVVISPFFGAYRASTIYSLSSLLWKTPLIWLFCGLVALVGRVMLTDASFIFSFAIVSLVVQGGLLISWRIIFLLSSRSQLSKIWDNFFRY